MRVYVLGIWVRERSEKSDPHKILRTGPNKRKHKWVCIYLSEEGEPLRGKMLRTVWSSKKHGMTWTEHEVRGYAGLATDWLLIGKYFTSRSVIASFVYRATDS